MKNQVCTIYLLINSVNNKVYIGQTWSSLHIRMGRNGSNYKNSFYLYAAIKKYGIDNFHYQVLGQCNSQSVADYLETHYIQQYNSRDSEMGYNLKQGGSAGKHLLATKIKISNTLKNRAIAWTPEMAASRIKAISNYWLGKKRIPHNEKWKKENSRRMKIRHTIVPHPMLGKHHAEDSKVKMRKANLGIKRSLESIKRSAENRKIDLQQEQNIINLYLKNYTISKIRNALAVSVSTIYRVLKRNNIDLKCMQPRLLVIFRNT